MHYVSSFLTQETARDLVEQIARNDQSLNSVSENTAAQTNSIMFIYICIALVPKLYYLVEIRFMSLLLSNE